MWDLQLQEGTCAKAFLHSMCLGMFMLPFISSGTSRCENSKKEQNKEEKRTTGSNLIHRLLVQKIWLFIKKKNYSSCPIYKDATPNLLQSDIIWVFFGFEIS